MKTKIPLLILILSLFLVLPATAQESNQLAITLPDGQTVPLTGLSDDQARTVAAYMKKVAEAQVAAKEGISTVAPGMVREVAGDPERLGKYLDVISVAIKDFCSDMGVAVNEFIKTPVGMIVVGGAIWQFGGRDIATVYIPALWDIIICTPIMILTLVIGFFVWANFLKQQLVYEEIVQDGKVVKRLNPKRVPVYEFKSNDAKVTFLVIWLVGSFLTLLVCFCLAVSI